MTSGPTPRADRPRLRRFRWWDIETVGPLEAELFGPWRWSAETFWAELAAPNRWYVVAEVVEEHGEDAGTQLLGYAGLASNGAEADVQTIAVAPQAQGRGVGALLLGALLEEAARRGCSTVLLEVRADNEPAIRLYQRHGFERIAIRRGYYQPGDVDAHIMRLRPLHAGSPG
ncbi:MAG TPA: ribosomal protein S18-alanine N-acetyltransferase [Actinomycetales bacterium]|nr:ribosomal protein S18-alanine N-acetyltransferase [Actinomycetales bacterium]